MSGAAAARRSIRLRHTFESCGFAQSVSVPSGEQCGACLLELEDGISDDGEFVAILDCCRPQHNFHVGCILTWAEQENSCPLCKKRFAKIGIYGVHGQLLRATHVEERDQDFDGEEAREDDMEDDDIVCRTCGSAADDEAMLLCDGRGGQCNDAYHYYCVGLAGIPEGDWFCPSCERAQEDAPAAAPRQAGVKRERPDSAEARPAVRRNEGLAVRVKRELAAQSSVRRPSRGFAPSGGASASVASLPEARATSSAASSSARPARKAPADEAAAEKRLGAKRSARSDCASAPPSALSASRRVVAMPKLGPESFGGLCKETPKWISRQGQVVRVDLGGRGMRDAAAGILAQVVRASLAPLGRCRGLSLSVHLAGNRLHQAGMASLLDATAECGLPVVHVDLERNRLGPEAADWLAVWCGRRPSGPPHELLLSHNRIGDSALLRLLRELGGAQVAGTPPLWVEASSAGVRSIDSMLDELSATVPLCLALDRSACGPEMCGDGGVDASSVPRLHLFGILDQSRAERAEVNPQTAPEVAVKREPEMPPERPRAEPPRREGRAAEPPVAQEAFALPPPSEAPVELDLDSSDSGAPQPRAGRRGRGGRGRGRGAGADPHGVRAPFPPPAVDPGVQAALDRRAWASTLGKQGPSAPSVAADGPDGMPNYGLWDLATRRPAPEGAKRRHPKAKPERADTLVDKPWVANAWVPTFRPLNEAPPLGARAPAGAGSGSGGAAADRPQSAAPPANALRGLVHERLRRALGLWKQAKEDERKLRLRCFRDQLCRLAQLRFQDVLAKGPSTWEEFLRKSSGYRLVADWVDRKAAEQLQKQQGASGRR